MPLPYYIKIKQSNQNMLNKYFSLGMEEVLHSTSFWSIMRFQQKAEERLSERKPKYTIQYVKRQSLIKEWLETKFNQDVSNGTFTMTKVRNNGTVCVHKVNITDFSNLHNITPFKEKQNSLMGQCIIGRSKAQAC